MTETTAKDRAMLYRKIAKVTAEVKRIPKNGRNSFHNYNYATESDITDGLRDLLNDNGLAFLPPSVLEYERNETVKKNGDKGDDLTRVKMQFEIACTETGEVYSSILWGEGQDSGDKGFYKAYTGAVKYFLMKTFLIATGDDPEQDQRPAPQQQRSASYQPPRQQPSMPRADTRTPIGQQPQAPARICEVHNIPMVQGSKGGWYCKTKVQDAEGNEVWCRGRSLKPVAPAAPPADDISAEWDAIDAAAAARK